MLKLSQRAQGLATEYVRYNEVSLNRDPFPYIVYYCREERHSLYRGPGYMEVRLIEVPL